MRSVLMALALLAMVTSPGCSTPLQQYISEHKYTPFEAPRSGDAVFTVIDFVDGRENIVADADECFRGVESKEISIALPVYELKAENTLELRLAGVLDPKLNLVAAFSDTRVKTIRIEFVNPFYVRATDMAVEARLQELSKPPVNACVVKLSDPSNYMIKQALGAQGLRYSFLDSNKLALTIDAQLLDKIDAGTTVRSNVESKQSLDINTKFYAGYRLWQPRARSAFGQTSFTLKELDPGAVQAAKRETLKKR